MKKQTGLITMDALIRERLPDLVKPVPSKKTLSRWFRAAGIGYYKANMRCTHGGGVHYFSDAGVLTQDGIPSVLFGPGDIAQAHTADEWVAVKQVEQATELLRHFLERLE